MEYWIDVEDGSGNTLGSGPIASSYTWTSHPRLDNAGDFVFEMPAGDPKAAALANKRYVRCYGVVGGAVTELAPAGIIDTIERAVNPAQNGPVLRVRGPDLLSELLYRSVGDLRICELGWTYLNDGRGAVRRLYFPNDERDSPNMYDANLVTHDNVYLWRDSYPDIGYLYVGYDARFDKARFTIVDRPNTEAATLAAQYFDGSAWRDLAITDGTDVAGVTMAQSGTVEWTRPADWARNTPTEESGSWFWVRFTVGEGQETLDAFRIEEIEVYADVPTKGGVDLIMAYAPDTWVRSGYADTVAAKYIEFNGESVLAALRMLTEQGGQDAGEAIREHFRLIHPSDAGYPAGGRAIEWLGTSTTVSGIRAMRVEDGVAFEGNEAACAIVDLTERLETSDAISRIIPTSVDGITLAATTRSAPAGYTLDAAANYIRRDQAETDLGRIEEARQFTDVSSQQGDSPEVHAAFTADALFDRALEYLRTHSAVNRFYNLVTTRVPGAVLPGETLDVVYHDYADGYHSVDIDTVVDGAPLHVLATVIAVDARGVHTVGFETATIDREAATDGSLLVQTIQDVRRLRAAQGGQAVVLNGLGTDGGPQAGVDIRVEGRTVNRKGNTILVYHANGATLTEQEATAAGLTAALAEAANGDVIWLTPGTYTGTWTVPEGVGVVSLDDRTAIYGPVTLSPDVYLKGISVRYTAESAGTVAAIIGPATGKAILNDCHLEARNTGAGDACAIEMGAGELLVWSCLTEGYATGGGAGYGIYAGAGTCTVQAGFTYGTSGAILGDNIERTTLDGLIKLHSAGDAVMGVFAPTSAGFDLALAAAVDGDVVLLPAGTIDGDHTVGAGVEVCGRGRENTVLSGQVTLGDGAVLRGLSVLRAADQAGDLIGVVAPASGMAYVIGCDLRVENATGDGYAAWGNLGNLTLRWCSVSAQSAGVDGNPFNGWTLGGELDSGALTVTDPAGSTVSGLSVGSWYAIEATGGPVYHKPATHPDDWGYGFQVSNDGGSTWSDQLGVAFEGTFVTPPSWGAHAELADEYRARLYWQATTTSIKVRVYDTDDVEFFDNTGDLGWKLSSADGALYALGCVVANADGRAAAIPEYGDRASWRTDVDDGGTHADDWAAGDSHHAAVTLGAGSDAALSLSGQELTLADVLTPVEHDARDHTGVPGVGGATRWEPLTNGDGAAPELLWTPDGDVIMVEVNH